MTIQINPKYSKFTRFISEMPLTFSQSGKVIYDGRNEIRVIVHDGLAINVKRYKVPNIINRMAYSSIRKPKCVRAYEYAFNLREKGFETPEPIAYIVERKGGLITTSYFISIQSDYDRMFYEFGKGGVEGREDIIRAFARYTAHLHEAGVFHKDYSPGNILFKKTDDEVRFSLVDINRMSFAPVSLEKGCSNFARLWGQEDFFRIIAEEYAAERNFNSRNCLKLILRYRRDFWKRFARKRPIPFEL